MNNNTESFSKRVINWNEIDLDSCKVQAFLLREGNTEQQDMLLICKYIKEEKMDYLVLGKLSTTKGVTKEIYGQYIEQMNNYITEQKTIGGTAKVNGSVTLKTSTNVENRLGYKPNEFLFTEEGYQFLFTSKNFSKRTVLVRSEVDPEDNDLIFDSRYQGYGHAFYSLEELNQMKRDNMEDPIGRSTLDEVSKFSVSDTNAYITQNFEQICNGIPKNDIYVNLLTNASTPLEKMMVAGEYVQSIINEKTNSTPKKSAGSK